MTVCSCDLGLDPMTLMYELDIDILKMYLRMKNDKSWFSKVRGGTVQTQTHTHTEKNTQTDATDCINYHTAFAGGNDSPRCECATMTNAICRHLSVQIL